MHEVPHHIVGGAHRKLLGGDTSEAEKLFNPLAECVKIAGIAHSVHIVEGSPQTHISRFASEKKIDIVVMCTDGHDETGKLAMGSIAERVFQYLGVPLLVVH
jgi:nucleotide-binding universal stress UspA family protein